MASFDMDDTSSIASPLPPPLFLEVFCEKTGKDYRFSTGTKAEFAVSLINRKLGSSKFPVTYIEAVKEDEEPISFGGDAYLVNYGHGWKLKTVTDADFPGSEKSKVSWRHTPHEFSSDSSMSDLQSSKDSKSTSSWKGGVVGEISWRYIGKIVIAFVLMFVLGGLFTMALDNLPKLILLFNNSSSM